MKNEEKSLLEYLSAISMPANRQTQLQKIFEDSEAMLTFIREQTGWHGRGDKSIDHFYCEFCDQCSLDDSLIEHLEGCAKKRIIERVIL